MNGSIRFQNAYLSRTFSKPHTGFIFAGHPELKSINMNKEISSNNYQSGGHQEGTQNNISQQRNDGINNPPTLNDQQESRETRETESDSAQHQDTDVATRKGNSSI